MAIHTIPTAYNAETREYEVSNQEVVTYEGRVILVESKCMQIMSDVWENVTTAVVFSPETKGQHGQKTDYTRVWVRANEENSQRFNHAKVDAPAELISAYHAAVAAQRKQREDAERAYREAQARSRIEKGKIVKVVKGRKVPRGTVGMVFWEGNNGWGPMVGIALSPKKGPVTGKNGKTYNSYTSVVFVAVNNVEVVGRESDEAIEAAVAAWEGQEV